MSYNKTLLYSGNTNVSSCTLSESTSNFRRLEIHIGYDSPLKLVEIPSFINKSNQILIMPHDWWTTDSYIIRLLRISIDSTGKNLRVEGHNVIGLREYTPYIWGNYINYSNNIKAIIKVYGVDRIDYKEEVGKGSPGYGWRKYNEALLWSGTNTSVINLSESASNFERLRIKLGTPTTAQTYMEVGAPSADGNILMTNTATTESAAIYRLAWSNWIWSNDCKTLTAMKGKSFRNTNTHEGPITRSLDNSDTDINKRPILEIVGINRK